MNTTIVELQEDLQEALKANEKLEERLQDLADIKPIIVKVPFPDAVWVHFTNIRLQNEPRDYLGEELQAMVRTIVPPYLQK